MRRRRRRQGPLGALAAWGATALLVGAVVATLAVAQTRANTVTARNADVAISTITPNVVKPTSCAALALTALVTGSGQITGSATVRNELLLGANTVDVIKAKDGNDCLVGGSGNDELDGEGGTDVCIGGPGNDKFAACETIIQ